MNDFYYHVIKTGSYLCQYSSIRSLRNRRELDFCVCFTTLEALDLHLFQNNSSTISCSLFVILFYGHILIQYIHLVVAGKVETQPSTAVKLVSTFEDLLKSSSRAINRIHDYRFIAAYATECYES